MSGWCWKGGAKSDVRLSGLDCLQAGTFVVRSERRLWLLMPLGAGTAGGYDI